MRIGDYYCRETRFFLIQNFVTVHYSIVHVDKGLCERQYKLLCLAWGLILFLVNSISVSCVL